MAVSFEQINALFKETFGPGPVETQNIKPYFITSAKEQKVSEKYSVPVNLQPGHSMRYSGNAFESVSYKDNRSPIIEQANGTVTAKFFKVEVPLGIIDGLNKSSGKESAAYKTAQYFIQESIRTNQVLAELSYMYGEDGMPEIFNNTASFNGQNVTTANGFDANDFAVDFVAGSTSTQILRLLANSVITINQSANAFIVKRVSATQLLLNGLNAPTLPTAAADAVPCYIDTQRNNDNIGLFQLFNNTGEVLGIDGDKYHNWNSVKYDAVQTRLTLPKVKDVATQLIVEGGIMNEDLCLYLSQETWSDLSDEIDGARQFDSSYNKGMNVVGQKEIGIMHSNGMIKIKMHPLMKRNTAFLMTDPTKSDNLVTLTTDKVMSFENNKEFQSAENTSSAYVIGKMFFSPFVRNRKRHALITGIVNT